jgi:hypothetical protein
MMTEAQPLRDLAQAIAARMDAGCTTFSKEGDELGLRNSALL